MLRKLALLVAFVLTVAAFPARPVHTNAGILRVAKTRRAKKAKRAKRSKRRTRRTRAVRA